MEFARALLPACSFACPSADARHTHTHTHTSNWASALADYFMKDLLLERLYLALSAFQWLQNLHHIAAQVRCCPCPQDWRV